MVFYIKTRFSMARKTYSDELNFLTLTVVNWIDVFTRRTYSDFIIDNLVYCRENKWLRIYAYVLMPNHLHLIAQSENLSDIFRDFKTFTSKRLYKMICNNHEESKKGWMIDIFKRKGKENSRNLNYQFWQNGIYPIALYSNEVIEQKVDYIHQNPVKAGFVDSPEKYYYSSANPLSPLELES